MSLSKRKAVNEGEEVQAPCSGIYEQARSAGCNGEDFPHQFRNCSKNLQANRTFNV